MLTTETHDTEIIIEEAYKIVGELALFPLSEAASIPLFKSMARQIQENKELVFILPAFPAKSPSPLKTSGQDVDLGEFLSLKTLNEVCRKLSRLYSPGARMIICSDGRVFSDLVMVKDEVIDQYGEGIQKIIQDYRLDFLSTLSMDDLYPELKGDELREKLITLFGKTTSEVRELVSTHEDFRKLFNGMHRFLLEDQLVLKSGLSKNQVSKETRSLTYELIRRSDAWSSVLNYHFPEGLRLSIHPYPAHHEKFGIKLIRSSAKWATPWHNVTVKIKESFELMHLQEALKLNAVKKFFEDRYAYYEVL